MTNTKKSNHLNLEDDDYCPKCHTKRFTIVNIPGLGKRKVPCICRCQQEANEKAAEKERKTEQRIQLEKLRNYSLMDKQFYICAFENFKIDQYNKDIYTIAINYCNEWTRMKKENVGMTLMGPVGIGKSYLSFCIANRLIRKNVPTIAISSINIINKIYESYGKFGQEGEVAIINKLRNADLLVLDDLGAEHSSKNGKEKQIIYSIIDSRIRTKKPMIITTNLNKEQLRDKLIGVDGVDRTFDRLLAACPVIEIEGKSRRMDEGNEKFEILVGLLK